MCDALDSSGARVLACCLLNPLFLFLSSPSFFSLSFLACFSYQIALLVWFMWPGAANGANFLYQHFIRKFLTKHQSNIDSALNAGKSAVKSGWSKMRMQERKKKERKKGRKKERKKERKKGKSKKKMMKKKKKKKWNRKKKTTQCSIASPAVGQRTSRTRWRTRKTRKPMKSRNS